MKKLLVVFIFLAWQQIFSQPASFSLVSPANGAYANATPNFIWGVSTGAIKYLLYIDGALKDSAIGTSYQLSSTGALSEGLHTWYVKAVDGTGGTTQSSQTFSVRVDATPPIAFDLTGPADGSWTNILQPNFQWSVSNDAGAGLAKYQLWIDGNLNSDNIPISENSLILSYPLSNGNHIWNIKAIDSVGNTTASNNSRIIRIDNIPPGAPDYSIYFDGQNGYIQIPDNPSLNPTAQITVEAFVYFVPGGASQPRIVSKVLGQLSTTGYELFLYGNRDSRSIYFFLGLQSGKVTLTTGSNNIQSYEWNHIIASYDGFYMYIYVNGELIASRQTSGGAILSNSSELNIGQKSSSSYDKLKGYIDEVRIWSTARSPIDLGTTRILDGHEPNLIGYWQFNEGTGDSVFDHTINRNNGILMSGSSFSNNYYLGIDLGSLCDLKYPNFGQYIGITTPTLSWSQAIDTASGFKNFQVCIDNSIHADNLTDSSYTILSPLTDGQHTWWIAGFDNVGNNRTSAKRVFIIDTRSPESFALLSPIDSAIINLPTPNFTWLASNDSGSGISKYQLWIDGVLNIDNISPTTTATAPSSVLNKGQHTWFVKAYDGVGNSRSSSQIRTLFIDYNPPTAVRLLSPVTNDTIDLQSPAVPIVFRWTKSVDPDPGDSIRYQLTIKGPGLDSAFSFVRDTTLSLDIMANLLTSSQYRWSVRVNNGYVTVASPDTFLFVTSPQITGIIYLVNNIPATFSLEQNYPNPFNPSTTIKFSIPKETYATLNIFNSLGQEVAQLVSKDLIAGTYTSEWNASGFASGVYYCRLNAGQYKETKKIILLK